MRTKSVPTDTDPAERWLAESFLGNIAETLDPVSLTLRTKAALNAEITRLLALAGQVAPPVSPDVVAQHFPKVRIQVEKIPMSSNHYGELIPVEGGFIVRLDSRSSEVRRRFALAHELGHTFFYERGGTIPRLAFSRARYWVEEGYASEVARNILVPEPMLRKNMSGTASTRPSLQGLSEVSRVYNVSEEVMRKRLVGDLHMWDCLIFRSTVLDGVIETPPSQVLKGSSFEMFAVPKRFDRDTGGLSELAGLVISADKLGHEYAIIPLKTGPARAESMRSGTPGKRIITTLICHSS